MGGRERESGRRGVVLPGGEAATWGRGGKRGGILCRFETLRESKKKVEK